MKNKISAFILIVICMIMLHPVSAQTKEKIDSAISNGETIFLVVCKGNDKLPEAKLIADNAQKNVPKSTVIILDKSNKSNTAIVKKYELSNAPVPSFLIIASNGVEVKRFSLNQTTTAKLIEAIPSKKEMDALFAFSQNKSVFMVLSRDSLTEKKKVLEECEKSCTAMQHYAVIIDINIEDPSEKKFLKTLNTEFSASKSKVLVFNSKGKFIKEFEAPVKSVDLTNAAIEDSDCPCSKSKVNKKKLHK